MPTRHDRLERPPGGRLGRLAGRVLGLALVAGPVLTGLASAHAGTLARGGPKPLSVPTWLFLTTGGAVIGVSFLLASFLTDRDFIAAVHEPAIPVPIPRRALAWAGRLFGLAALAVVLVAGFVGPTEALENPAVVLVWVGWWAGYAMTTYLVGNSWPAVNPFRTLARPFGDGRRDYPSRLGAWPSVAFLLLLVYVEITVPLAEDPRLLAAGVLAYGALALAGSALYGRDTWFDRVDPISRVFRMYGSVAPVQRTPEGLRIGTPGSGLRAALPDDPSEVGFVVALVWATTFDGLSATPLWRTVAETVVPLGVPPHLLYLVVLVAGYLAFLAVFAVAATVARRTAPTYRTTGELARSFAPALLAIAAAYHLAHYLTYLLGFLPLVLDALVHPLGVPHPAVLALPSWVGGVPIAAVLLGHLLAVWAAHTVAFERFPGRLQALRSQYAVTGVMVLYTMTSLWIVSTPDVPTPLL